MRIDFFHLPMATLVSGFLVAVLALTFALAFLAVGGEGGEEGARPLAAASASPEPARPAPAAGGTIAVTMGDNFFQPNEITVPAGATVTFDITNGGQAIHNMRIAGEDGKYDTEDDAVSDPDIMPGGATGTLTWTAPSQPGEIVFRCDFHSIDMTGRIIVQ